MATFKRTLSDKQRAAMIERKMALRRRVMALPAVDITMRGTAGRAAAKNYIIAMTHRKGGMVSRAPHVRKGMSGTVQAHDATYQRVRLDTPAADKKRAYEAVRELRTRAIYGDAMALKAMFVRLGEMLAAGWRRRIATRLIDTGALAASVDYVTRNV